jgi:DNA-directed RNA polymerase subunit beta'
VVYGAYVRVADGEHVKAGAVLVEWDPFVNPILSESNGVAKFGDLIEGATMREQVDEFTGVSSKVIIESKDPELRPRISIKDAAGETMARALLPVGAALAVSDGQEVEAGDVLAKMPRETTKTKDITGGLPRVAELFEARKPKDFAIVTEIDGVVSFGPDSRGKRRIIVTSDLEGAEPKEYLIPKGKHISVHEGDVVRAGEALMDGSSNPHDILKIKGEKELAKYLVDEVQEVYRLQGVRINDKHIEVIVRQMLRRVRVIDVGDTDFLVGEHVEKIVFGATNSRMVDEGKQPALAEPLLLGITKASLSTESFISAASFQETTKVLTEASMWGKVDQLRGLKENVIMGRLIPAGTGMARYHQIGIQIDAPEELMEGPEEEPLVEVPSPSEAPIVSDGLMASAGSPPEKLES